MYVYKPDNNNNNKKKGYQITIINLAVNPEKTCLYNARRKNIMIVLKTYIALTISNNTHLIQYLEEELEKQRNQS